HLAYQSWGENGTARIRVLGCKKGQWSQGPPLPGEQAGGNRWHPAIAAGPGGQVAVAYDAYRDGDYDVFVAISGEKGFKEYAIATSPRFEARPSLAYDGFGHLWIAYEEGPEKWGKDYG